MAELLMNESLNILYCAGLTKARNDGACLGFVFVGIAAAQRWLNATLLQPLNSSRYSWAARPRVSESHREINYPHVGTGRSRASARSASRPGLAANKLDFQALRCLDRLTSLAYVLGLVLFKNSNKAQACLVQARTEILFFVY